jgi:hypothetical protein
VRCGPQTSLLRFIRIHVIGIVEETRPDRVDDAPGWRSLGGDGARQLNGVSIAYQATEIDDMIGCGDDLHRSPPGIDPRLDQGAGDILLHSLVRGQARLFRCLDLRQGQRQSHASKKDFGRSAHYDIIAKAEVLDNARAPISAAEIDAVGGKLEVSGFSVPARFAINSVAS